MLHYKTKQQIGEGFVYNEKEHKEKKYNSLISPYAFEQNTMRTKYLIRDVWNLEQLQELQKFLVEEINNKQKS
tara:strand:+ start:181 stop:399 length:219 start_codon:yes stop_codon:yes gene_type:complete